MYVLAYELKKTPDEIRALPVPDFTYLMALHRLRNRKPDGD